MNNFCNYNDVWLDRKKIREANERLAIQILSEKTQFCTFKKKQAPSWVRILEAKAAIGATSMPSETEGGN